MRNFFASMSEMLQVACDQGFIGTEEWQTTYSSADVET